MKKLIINRRQVLQMGAASLLLPSSRIQANEFKERKFLFVFCPGGWDQCYLFAPLHGEDAIDMEHESTESVVQGIRFVDSAAKENVRSFFEQHGQRTAIINGIESRSVAHDVCLRLICTGSSISAVDDWPSTIAAHSTTDPIMPMVSISGPLYTHNYGDSVVRIGSKGQLASLLNGDAINELNQELGDDRVQALLQDEEDIWVEQLINMRRDAPSLRGRAEEILRQTATAEERMQRLSSLSNELDLTGGSTLRDRLGLALDILSFGSSRCVMVGYEGWQGLGWDTHAANFLQAIHLNELFGDLDWAVTQLQQRQSNLGGSLLDEVTVVVMSEMGRFPQLNSREGKEHWTYTSALLLGDGVRGGQTIGEYDSSCFGLPVDLNSGEVSSNGEKLLPSHLGATLLQLANLDPRAHIDEAPISAILEEV